jgi:hypothetical protein
MPLRHRHASHAYQQLYGRPAFAGAILRKAEEIIRLDDMRTRDALND